MNNFKKVECKPSDYPNNYAKARELKSGDTLYLSDKNNIVKVGG